MMIPQGATIAVADGEKLNLFRNHGDDIHPKIEAEQDEAVDTDNKGSGARHQSSSANPDQSRLDEDSFAAGIAEMLNRQVLGGKISKLIIIAAPKTLGELRKHYHNKLTDVLLGEIAKDLTGHSIGDIEKAIAAA